MSDVGSVDFVAILFLFIIMDSKVALARCIWMKSKQKQRVAV